MLKSVRSYFLACAAVLIFCPGALHATSTTQSEDFDSTDFSFSFLNSASYSPTIGFSVAQFDPSLGTLDNVSFSFHFTVNAQINFGEAPGGATFSGGGSFLWDTNLFSGTGSGASTGGGFFSSSSLSYNVSGSIVAGDDGLTLDLVQGTGTSILSWQPGFSMSVPDGASGSGALASGNLTITYDYTPVPEPTTMSLAAVAIFIGFQARNRRRTQA